MTARALEISDRARQIYQRSIVWDMTLPYGAIHACDGVTLDRFRNAGIGLVSLTIGNDRVFGRPELALSNIAKVHAVCARNADKFRIAYSTDDIDKARSEGLLAICFNFQGSNVLGNDTASVEVFYRLGVRHMLFAYNQRSLAGDGCGESTDAGLSRYGRSVIREMNRVGMIVDGSHCGHRTSMEAMDMSSAPCIFSHANAYSVHAHYRNIKDDQIRRCADTGGVIGINGLGAYIDDVDASSDAMFRHIDFIANLVGPQHVGIGLDYVRDVEGFWKSVDDLPDLWPDNQGKPMRHTRFAQPEQLLELAELMCRHGYADDDVAGILGGNFHRVCKQVWQQT